MWLFSNYESWMRRLKTGTASFSRDVFALLLPTELNKYGIYQQAPLLQCSPAVDLIGWSQMVCPPIRYFLTVSALKRFCVRKHPARQVKNCWLQLTLQPHSGYRVPVVELCTEKLVEMTDTVTNKTLNNTEELVSVGSEPHLSLLKRMQRESCSSRQQRCPESS